MIYLHMYTIQSLYSDECFYSKITNYVNQHPLNARLLGDCDCTDTSLFNGLFRSLLLLKDFNSLKGSLFFPLQIALGQNSKPKQFITLPG